MTTIASTVEVPGAEYAVDPAELAAVAFLARYSGRTLDAYRHDLRNLFQQLDSTLAQIDAALDRTRADRVAALADDPPEHLVHRIGPAPDTPAGRAVWCHHALDIEAAFDRHDGRKTASSGLSPRTDPARRQIAVADRDLKASTDRPGPSEWAELAQQAGAVADQLHQVEHTRAARQRTVGQSQQPHRTPLI